MNYKFIKSLFIIFIFMYITSFLRQLWSPPTTAGWSNVSSFFPEQHVVRKAVNDSRPVLGIRSFEIWLWSPKIKAVMALRWTQSSIKPSGWRFGLALVVIVPGADFRCSYVLVKLCALRPKQTKRYYIAHIKKISCSS